MLGYLWAGDTFINLEMVLNGYALWDFWPPNNRYDDELLEAEFQARKEWKGIWKSPVPTRDDKPFDR
jgi:endonuclease YncB( thermonuclease family)